MFYPAEFQPDGSRWLATFRDVPEALTGAATLEEAREMAADALLTAMEAYFEEKRAVPLPSKARKGEELVQLPVSAWAKVLLLNEMLSQHVRAAGLARKLGTTPQVVNRIVDLRYPTKIDTVAAAIGVLGRHLEVRLT